MVTSMNTAMFYSVPPLVSIISFISHNVENIALQISATYTVQDKSAWLNNGSIKWNAAKRTLGLYSLSGRTSYRNISWSLEAAKLDVIMIESLWNLTSQQCCCWGACQISERLEKSKPESRGFETSGKTPARLMNRGLEWITAEKEILIAGDEWYGLNGVVAQCLHDCLFYDIFFCQDVIEMWWP